MKKKDKQKAIDSLCTLPFGKYSECFEFLQKEETRNLTDTESSKNSFMPIKVNDEMVFLTEPDGKLIPDMDRQQKCDFLLYCKNKPQVCFIELKGETIPVKKDYNPFDQIMDTIYFLQTKEELKGLVDKTVEKHAFIVSPGRQKIPKGIESKERQLWQKLAQAGAKKSKISDLVHFVKATKSDRYSNKSQIICSPGSPVPIPFQASVT